MDLRAVDLNLLVSLQVLLEERHVTRSAERLGVTQPAMSAALARLRAVFGDPLLVRGPKGMVATPRAEQLLAQLGPVLAHIDQMVAPPSEFVPAASRRTFTLIGSDLVEFVLLPPLMAALADEAPGVQVLFKGPDFDHLEARLAGGDADLAIGYCPAAPDPLITSAVFREPFVCVARRGHPALDGEGGDGTGDGGLTLDRYVELRHVQALPEGSTMYAAAIDAALAALGVVRRVALWEPSFLAIASVVARTDLISTVPARVAAYAARALPITVHALPLALPETDVAMYWHPRSRDDAGHRWFRGRAAELMRG